MRSYPAKRETNPHLRVTVVFTTAEATISALQTAGKLAKNLEARIALVAIEDVPLQLSLHRPVVPVDLLERQLLALLATSSIDVGEVEVQICLCRDYRQALQKMLQPHSLVVIGGRARSWSRERKVEQWLCALGHEVVSVKAAHPIRKLFAGGDC